MKFYTPGHGIITDTLIMHGLVRIIAANNILDGVVTREGTSYVIEINTDKITTKVDFLDTIYKETILYTQNDEVKLIYKYLSKIDASNINLPYYSNWINNLNKGLEELNITTFSYPDHKEELKEGRVKSKKLIALPLPLSFVYGKYFQNDYGVEGKPYSVCLNCYTLSTIGLIFGTSIIYNISNDKKNVNLITLGPSREMKLIDVLVLQRLLEKKPLLFKNDLQLLASLLYVLSLGETLYALNEDIDAIIWRLTKQKNFQRASIPTVINIKELLEKISTIKYYFPNLPKFIDECLTSNDDGAIALNDLAFYLINSDGDSYGVMRKISTLALKLGCNYDISQLEKAIEKAMSNEV
ncbi:hypothetical protein [Saccharolobus shibatae]|uniref:CRISPR-associated protein n=1 Tax=Saccharolobus shibatae TaxID=2286 RepID=A0A8F5BVD0_9CREN|nr:hypothetical protein [Saccharolobus shibatae]QXJ32142.1 hypothetical protein J5U21_01793 [Saccharolobus shibatae]